MKSNEHPGKIPLLSMKKAIEFLDCSERTVHRYIADNKIRAYKFDGMLKFNPADLMAFLKRRAVGYGKGEAFADVPIEEIEKKTIVADKSKYYALTDEEAKEMLHIVSREQFDPKLRNVERDADGNLIGWDSDEDRPALENPDDYRQP